jgi:hypothetical protein
VLYEDWVRHRGGIVQGQEGVLVESVQAEPQGPGGGFSRRFFRQIGVGVVLAALAACGDDVSSPGAIEGVYELRRLNQEPLPYDHEGLGCCTYLDGRLDLDGGGYAASLTARNRDTGLVFTAMEWGTYTRQASSLSFELDSIAVAPLLLDAGTISADTLRVTFGGEGPGSPDQFQAVYVRQPS